MVRRSFLTVLLAVSTLLPRAPANGQILLQLWNIDRGTSEREWSYTRKPATELITFGWIPELDPLTSIYFVQARCDIDSKKAKKNKVFFENVQLTGVTSENTVGAEKTSKLIKKGEGKTAVWDLTPHVSNFLSDSIVLVSGEFRATKQLKAFQAMTCSLSVWELFDIDNLKRATEAERLRYFREVVEPADAPSKLFDSN